MVRSADIVADPMLEGTGCAAHPATVKIRTATNAKALMMPAVPGRTMSLNTNSRKIDQPAWLGSYANHSAVSVIGFAGCGIQGGSSFVIRAATFPVRDAPVAELHVAARCLSVAAIATAHRLPGCSIR